ncbi:MAG TPA: exopolysaccharide biosynthesis polyprenyl glycosylphosphotransferase, partial [Alphaproteobacteria bacterium]|nr:exopolysaccharide biosynthesis polyprenyl glycosylphosphotransferase [Alphaproteobacteria bacterium]
MGEARASANVVPTNRQSQANFQYSSAIVPGIVLASDFLAIVIAGALSYFWFVEYSIYTLEYYVFAVSFVVFVSIILLDRAQLYETSIIMGPIWRSDGILVALATAFLFLLSIAFSFKATEVFARAWVLSFFVTSFFVVWTFRGVLREVFKSLARQGLMGRSLVVLGSGEQARQFLERLHRVDPHFTSVSGVFDRETCERPTELAGHRVLGGLDDLVEAARRAEIDDVVIAMPWNADREVTDVVERLKELPVNVFVSMDLVGFQLTFRPAVGDLNELPMFEVVHRPISGWGYLIKRIEDLVLASAAVILLSPFLILIAILIKLDSPGPVFFRQARLGFNNQQFDIFKFRSMHHRDIPEEQVKQASKNDPRITRVGRFIRRTSIDELPQLFNVLNGSMSLVGPRPHAVSHNE